MNERPNVAILCGVLRPYRVHFHKRIVREIPGIHLYTLVTHEFSVVPNPDLFDPEINPVLFGAGESVARQGRLKHQHAAWQKGGRITRWLKEHDIRAVICVGYDDAAFVRTIFWCRRAGVPCFLWGDSNIKGDKAKGFKAVVKKSYLRNIVRSCTGVMPCGLLGKAYFEKYGAQPDRIFLAPYEPDYALIESVDATAVQAVCHEYRIAAGRKRIVYAGRLVRRKRVDLLLEAFQRIAAERPEWDLLIVGDGGERTNLQAAVRPEFASRVQWIRFLDDQAKLTALYKACDVFVLPSEYEAWALVVNEAVAAGLAFVASDVVGAAHELVEDGVNGRVFPSGNVEALADCLLDVTTPGRTESMKAAATTVLGKWRSQADPVNGLISALRFAKVVPDP